MKKTISYLLFIFCLFASGCGNKQGGNENTDSPNSVTFHNVEFIESSEIVSLDYFRTPDFQRSYHASKKYTCAKLTLTSENLLYDPSEPTGQLYGIDKIECLVAVNDKKANPFLAFLPLNFDPNAMSPANIVMYPPLSTISSISLTMERVMSCINGTSSYDFDGEIYKYKLIVDGYTFCYGDEYYLSSIDYDDGGNRKYHIDIDYFGLSDIPTTTKAVSKETFLEALFAKSYHKVNKSYVHFTATGHEKLMTNAYEDGTCEMQDADITYNEFIHISDYTADLLLADLEAYSYSVYNYQIEHYKPTTYAGFPNEHSLAWFQSLLHHSFTDVGGGCLFLNTYNALQIPTCNYYNGSRKNTVVSESYYINDFRCYKTFKSDKLEMRFDDEGYITYYTVNKLKEDGTFDDSSLVYTYKYNENLS